MADVEPATGNPLWAASPRPCTLGSLSQPGEVFWNAMSIRAKLAVVALATLALSGIRGTWAVEIAGTDESVDRATQAALDLDIHPKQGASLFARRCARCHGDRAQGNPRAGAPTLAGQRFAYLVRQLANFAGNERESDPMHRVTASKAMQDPQSWADLAGYLNGLPPPRNKETGDGLDVALGGAIFREQCASCHRADAHGDRDGFVPSLRGQRYPYLVSQLHRLARGDRHNADEDLIRFIKSFDEREILAVSDYLSRLRGAAAEEKSMRNDGSVVD